MTTGLLILMMLGFQTKHLLADFVFQSGWIVRTKGIYGHPGGFVHAGIHAVMSLPILMLAPLSAGMVLLIAAGEFVVHYHVDWSKDRILKRMNTNPTEWRYWVLTGADQYAHQVTYLAMLAVAIQFG